MERKYLIYMVALLAGLASCGEKNPDAITLSGTIEGMGTDTLYLYGTDKLYDRIDTLPVADGRFSATLSADTLVSVWLQFRDGTAYPLYMDKGERITVTGQAGDPSSLEATGNRTNDELTAFHRALRDTAAPGFRPAQEQADSFIRSHPASLASIYLLDKYFVSRPQPDFKAVERLAAHLSGELKDRPYLESLLAFTEARQKVAVGKTVPYFSLEDNEGKTLQRADYDGRYLLLHFWASWDKDSRSLNDSLRAIYRQAIKKVKKKDRKLELAGISLDGDKGTWLEAIRQDSLEWRQGCDFGGWNGKTARSFSLYTLPSNVLVGPEGKIVSWDLTPQEIRAKLEAVKDEKLPAKGQASPAPSTTTPAPGKAILQKATPQKAAKPAKLGQKLQPSAKLSAKKG